MLVSGIRRYGKDWDKVSKLVCGRNRKMCESRARRLVEKIKRDPLHKWRDIILKLGDDDVEESKESALK